MRIRHGWLVLAIAVGGGVLLLRIARPQHWPAVASTPSHPGVAVVVAPLGGTVAEVLASPGTTVNAGQIIVRLRVPELDQQTAKLRAALQQGGGRGFKDFSAALRRIPPSVWRQLLITDPALLAAEQEYAAAVAGRDSECSAAALARVQSAIERRSREQARIARLRRSGLEALTQVYQQGEQSLRWLEAQRSSEDLRAPIHGRVEILDLHPGQSLPPAGRVALITSLPGGSS